MSVTKGTRLEVMWDKDDANNPRVELILAGQRFDPHNDVAYTSESFKLEQLWKLHGHTLPFIIMVEEGYFGGQEFDVFSAGDVMWVTRSTFQMRVVALDMLREEYVSIPVDYPIQVQPVDSRGQEIASAGSLSDVLKSSKLPITVNLTNKSKMKFYMAADKEQEMVFETLRLVEMYEERYLLAHTIVTGEMFLGKPCVIPLYLPLEVNLGLFSKRGDAGSWSKFTSELKALDLAKLCDYKEHPMNKDLMVFAADDVKRSDGVYDYIEPTHFVKFKKYGTLPRRVPQPPGMKKSPPAAPVPEESAAPPAVPVRPPKHKHEPKSPKSPAPRPPNRDRKLPAPPSVTPQSDMSAIDKEECVYSGSSLGSGLFPYTQGGYAISETDSVNKNTAIVSPMVTSQTTTSGQSEDNTEYEDVEDFKVKSRAEYKFVHELTEKAKEMMKQREIHRDDYDEIKLEDSDELKISEKPVTKKPNVAPRRQKSVEIAPKTDESTSQQYKYIKDLPKDVSELNVSQLANCLELLNMSKLIPKFRERFVDGALLASLEPKDLQEEFELSPLTAKQLCMFAKNTWRPR